MVVVVWDHLRGVVVRHVSADVTLGIIGLRWRGGPSCAVECMALGRRRVRRWRISAAVRGPIVVGGFDAHWSGWYAVGE